MTFDLYKDNIGILDTCEHYVESESPKRLGIEMLHILKILGFI